MTDILRSYLEQAPISLALERAIEARHIRSLTLARPILDIGCGDGLFASIALPQGPDVGLDLSMSDLTMARSRAAYRHLIRGDAERLPFGDAAFETVISNSTLEHVRDIDRVLSEVARVVRVGGRIVITVPTPSYQRRFFWSRVFRSIGLAAIARLYEGSVNRVFRHRHVHTAHSWASILGAHGLAEERATPYLSGAVIALDDLLYPIAAPSLVWKALTGSYVVPLLRRPIAALMARALSSLYRGEAGADGGYVLLICRRAVPVVAA